MKGGDIIERAYNQIGSVEARVWRSLKIDDNLCTEVAQNIKVVRDSVEKDIRLGLIIHMGFTV